MFNALHRDIIVKALLDVCYIPVTQVCGVRLQIFLTANPKLRSEVAKQFHKLRAAILRNPEESKRLEDLSNQEYTSLADIPSDAFPLFWTTKQFLRAVDATLLPTPLSDGPFFPRCVPLCCCSYAASVTHTLADPAIYSGHL